jgi:hypothetical protein
MDARTQILPLLKTLRAVESSNGATSRNELQITKICVDDVNRIYGTKYKMLDAFDKRRSEEIAVLYLTYWAEQSRQQFTPELFARIWNGGPDGWKKSCTLPYWRRVKLQLSKAK